MRLSIIVCTRNRAYFITQCLDSIAASLSKIPPLEAEIIVVDNASIDNTAVVVTQWAESCTYPVHLLFEPRKGASIARNLGILAARGDILSFTDDDCRLSETYIRDLLRYYGNDTALVLRGGRIELGDPTDLPLTIKTDPSLMRWDKTKPSAKYALIGGKTISGCNMTMRREVIDRVGLFDELLGAGSTIPGGEDTDYCFRAYLSDIPVEYVPDMVIFHWHGRKSPSDANNLMKNYIIGTGALYAKYLVKAPYLCHELYWDFKKAIKDVATGQNTYLPAWNLSYRDKLVYCVVGMLRYFRLTLAAKVSKS